MTVCEIDVFEQRALVESDDSSSQTTNNAMRVSTVIETAQVSYLCEEIPFVSPF